MIRMIRLPPSFSTLQPVIQPPNLQEEMAELVFREAIGGYVNRNRLQPALGDMPFDPYNVDKYRYPIKEYHIIKTCMDTVRALIQRQRR
jgi:hypothetical protein